MRGLPTAQEGVKVRTRPHSSTVSQGGKGSALPVQVLTIKTHRRKGKYQSRVICGFTPSMKNFPVQVPKQGYLGLNTVVSTMNKKHRMGDRGSLAALYLLSMHLPVY